MNNKYTKELLSPIIKESLSWAAVCRKLDLCPNTGSQTYLKKRSIDFDIDFSHFTGQAWNRGNTYPYKNNIEEYLSGKKNTNSHRLRNMLIKVGYKDKKCENCGLSEWQGKELPLQLDHIDRNPLNNNLNNLQILCPNCHSQKTREQRKK